MTHDNAHSDPSATTSDELGADAGVTTRRNVMHALAIVGYDGPQAMEVIQRPVPLPGPGEVSVEVSHAGVGFIDGLFATGFGGVPLPFVPGLEVAGTIRALGEGVSGFGIGQRVAALTITTSGGYADVVVADARLVAPIPEGLDAATAAATCANTVTAVSALSLLSGGATGDAGDDGVLAERSVLVHAGVGGVGSQFGQVARALGAARTAAVVGSQSKAQVAERLGYDESFLRDRLQTIPDGSWDIVVDPVGGAATTAGQRHLAPFGTLLRVGNASGADPVAIDSMQLWLTGTSVSGFNLGAYTGAHPDRVGADLRRALDLVASGQVTVDVSRHVTRAQAPDALADVLAGATTGKVVITLQP